MARLCESVMRPSSRRFDRKQGEGKPDQGVMAMGRESVEGNPAN
jgi:hypothetical protein